MQAEALGFFLQSFAVELEGANLSLCLIICLDHLNWKEAIIKSSELDLGSSSISLVPLLLFDFFCKTLSYRAGFGLDRINFLHSSWCRAVV